MVLKSAYIKQPELSKMEPIKSSLYKRFICTKCMIINPWQFAIALSEVAIQNGVELRLNEEVTSIKKMEISLS